MLQAERCGWQTEDCIDGQRAGALQIDSYCFHQSSRPFAFCFVLFVCFSEAFILIWENHSAMLLVNQDFRCCDSVGLDGVGGLSLPTSLNGC